mmetsp:Transcript_2511/g.11175  ORF Transcript_2511/g.11175 Transcript_2511/m.11175 type:complete len:258 (+) Transcript_2511:3133-3906(+)
MNVAAPPTPAPDAPNVTIPALPGPTSSQLSASSLGSNESFPSRAPAAGGGVPARYSSSESSMPLSIGASGSRSGHPTSGSSPSETLEGNGSRSGHPRSSTSGLPRASRSPNRDWFVDCFAEPPGRPKVSGSRNSMPLGSMSTAPPRRPGVEGRSSFHDASSFHELDSFQPPASSSSSHPPPLGSFQLRPPAAVHPPVVSLVSPPRLFARWSPHPPPPAPPPPSSCRSMRMKHPVKAAANFTLTPPAPMALASSNRDT